MKRPGKPTLLMILLLLTGGAIINVAVAWGCAAWIDTLNVRSEFEVFSLRPNVHELVSRSGSAGHARFNRVKFKGDSANPIESPYPLTTSQMQIDGSQCSEDRAGWPLHALSSTNHGSVAVSGPNWFMTVLDSDEADVECGIKLTPYETAGVGVPGLGWRALPYGPIWPGFAINTIFYAAILWLPFAGFRLVRRRIRVRRGQCPACAYPIGTSNVCTECGKAVKPMATA